PQQGPSGGELLVEQGHLIELGTDGRTTDFGPAAVQIGRYGFRSWSDTERGMAVVQVLHIGKNMRSGLAVLTANGSMKFIGGEDHLDACALNEELSQAVCVQQSTSMPPRLVTVRISDGEIRKVRSLSERHERIEPLRTE